MLHGDHVVALLRHDLLMRDGVVMNRDGCWDHVRVGYGRSCGERPAQCAAEAGTRGTRREEDVGQRGERVLNPQILNLAFQFHPAILKPSPNLHQEERRKNAVRDMDMSPSWRLQPTCNELSHDALEVCLSYLSFG